MPGLCPVICLGTCPGRHLRGCHTPIQLLVGVFTGPALSFPALPGHSPGQKPGLMPGQVAQIFDPYTAPYRTGIEDRCHEILGTP